MVSALLLRPSCKGFPSHSISNRPKKNTSKKVPPAGDHDGGELDPSSTVSSIIRRTASGAAPRAEKAPATDPSIRRSTSISGSLSR